MHDGELTLAEIVAALDFQDAAVLRGIDNLTQRHLLVGRSGRYQLSHGLLRSVLYDDLPAASRPALHGRVAAVIEAHRPEEVELLAHHFRAGGLPDRAAVYLEQAAVRAIAVSAYSAAVDHLTQAAEVLGEQRHLQRPDPVVDAEPVDPDDRLTVTVFLIKELVLADPDLWHRGDCKGADHGCQSIWRGTDEARLSAQ